MFRSHRLTRPWIAVVAACLCLALGARAQDPSVPRGVLAGEFDLGTDPNSRPTEPRLKSVMRGGPGDLAGLRAGDVILKLGDEPVTLDTWSELMRDFPPGSQMKMTDFSRCLRPAALAMLSARTRSLMPKPSRLRAPASRKLRREMGPRQRRPSSGKKGGFSDITKR